MKKHYIFFVFTVILFSSPIKAQWIWQNPVPTGNVLSAIKYINQSKAFIVGGGSTILCSTDSGNSWTLAPAGKMGHLYDVDSYGEQLIVAVGENGLIVKSVDGGITWTSKILPVQTNLLSISIISQSLMVAAGGSKIIKSTDGGDSWSVPTAPELLQLRDVLLVSTKIGYAVGSAVYRTTDACQSFIKMNLPYSDQFLSISYPSSLAIYIASGRALYKSTDGGITWSNPAVFKDFTATKISFITNDLGYVIGSNGTVLKSTDGGVNWELISPPVLQCLNGFTVTASGDLLVCGDAGIIYKQSSGNWKAVTEAVCRDQISSIHFINATQGLACGASGLILKTSDGGKTWNRKTTGVNDSLKAVFQVSTLTAFATGNNYLASNDGGNSWETISFPTNSCMNAICFADQNNGYACGAFGSIVITTDGGKTWRQKISGTSNELNGICFIDKFVGFCVGQNTILKTSDGGESWNKELEANGPLYAISFKDKYTGLAFGGTGSYALLYGTSDAGNTWNLMTPPPGKGLFSGKYVSGTSVYTGGWNGAIFISTDDGISWTNTCWQAETPILSLTSINDSTIWACGYGAILRYGSNLATPVEEKPSRISNTALLQNYPNPFNPSTTIRYKIMEAGRVRLLVYDILGNELALLIDAMKGSGEYQVEFDASGFAGGIYFCRLTVDGKLVAVNKLICVK